MNTSTSRRLVGMCRKPFFQSITKRAASSSPLPLHAPSRTTISARNLTQRAIQPLQSRGLSTITPAQPQIQASDVVPITSTSPTSVTLPPGVTRHFGTVISAGRMQGTVRVEQLSTKYEKRLQKRFPVKTNYMVSDPRNSLREGDKIEFWSGHRVSEHIRHVVERIVVPFGTAIQDRPPVMTYPERLEKQRNDRKNKRVRKLVAAGDSEHAEVEVTGELRMGKIKERVMRRLERERERPHSEEATSVVQSI